MDGTDLMGYKTKSTKAESGFEHNPAATTPRGKRRAKRKKELREAGMPYQASDYKDTEAWRNS